MNEKCESAEAMARVTFGRGGAARQITCHLSQIEVKFERWQGAS